MNPAHSLGWVISSVTDNVNMTGTATAWRIDEVLARRGLHNLCLCSSFPFLQSATHFGKVYTGDCWEHDCPPSFPATNAQRNRGEFEYFERQATIATTISHPSLIPVIAHQLAAPRPLMVFPWFRMQPIDGWLAEQAQQPARAVMLWFARQLLEALDALHRHGYVHGNVTSDHVLLRDDERIVLVGLGGCEEVGAMTCLPRAETRYDSPEVAQGEFEASSAQDIYAAAIVIGEWLGGKYRNSPILTAMRAPAPQDRPAASELVKLFLALEIELFGQQIQMPRAA